MKRTPALPLIMVPGIMVLGTGAALAAPTYTLTDIGTLAGNESRAFGVNDLGQVTGSSTYAGGGSSTHAFRFTPGAGLQDLGTLGGTNSIGYAINNSGQVAGLSTTPGGSSSFSFRFTDGMGLQDLGNFGTANSFARGINAAGTVTGSAITAEGFHAYLYTDGGGLQDVGTLGGASSDGYAINASNQIVGSSVTATGRTHAFRSTPGSPLLDIGALAPEGPSAFSIAYGVNASGQTTGFYRTSSGGFQFYIYKDGDTVLTDLGAGLGKAFTVGNSINDAGAAVGYGTQGGEFGASSVGFYYSPTEGILDLNGLVDGSAAGWSLRTATGISNSGFITGTGIAPDGQRRAYLLTPNAPVPEPASFAILGVGLAALTRRRKRG